MAQPLPALFAELPINSRLLLNNIHKPLTLNKKTPLLEFTIVCKVYAQSCGTCPAGEDAAAATGMPHDASCTDRFQSIERKPTHVQNSVAAVFKHKLKNAFTMWPTGWAEDLAPWFTCRQIRTETTISINIHKKHYLHNWRYRFNVPRRLHRDSKKLACTSCWK